MNMGVWDSLSRGFETGGEALNGTIAFQKLNFWHYVKYYAVMAALGLAGAAAIATPFALLALLAIGDYLSGTALLGAGALMALLAAALGLFFAMLAVSTMFASIRYVMGEREMPFLQGRDRRPALKLALFYIGVYILLFAVFLGLPLALMFGGMLSGSQGGAAFGLLGGLLLFYAGIFLFIIFFYFFSFAFIYGQYEVAAEGMGPIDALKRSYSLVKSNFWETLVMLLIMLAISYVVGIVVQVALVPLLMLVVLSPVAGIALLLPAAIILGIAENALLGPIFVLFWMKIRSPQAALSGPQSAGASQTAR